MREQKYDEVAKRIVEYVIKSANVPLSDVCKSVEDTVRKQAHIEYMRGYLERKREEEDRHDILKAELNAAKEKIARNMPSWSDK